MGADAVRVAVGEEILRGHVPAVRIALEERSGLLYEVLPLFDRLFDLHDVARREFGDGKRLGGIDHEDGKLKLEIWVLRLFRIRAVQLERSFVGQESCLVAGTQVRMIEDRPWGWRVGAGGLCGHGTRRTRGCCPVLWLITLVKIVVLE